MEFHYISKKLKKIQFKTIKQLEQFETSSKFKLTEWDHSPSGGGLTRVLSKGNHIEKAAVNFSEVKGELSGTMQNLYR